jgi:lipopolysaccharide biosynthesis glycosyltransferase
MSDGHPLVIVCSADDCFAMPLGVALYSTLVNYRGRLPVRVFIINGGIHSPNRKRISRVLGQLGVAAEWIEPDWQPLQRVPESERYPASTYLKVLIPQLLPDWVKKAIYLDSDLVVHADIAELWDVPLEQKALLAVRDDGAPTIGSPRGLPNCAELGLDPSLPYFNSGVIVFDVSAWRERELACDVIDYVTDHPDQLRFGEQHALNAVLSRDWGALEPRWNQQVWVWDPHGTKQYLPGVLHFVFTSKPWKPSGAHWSNFVFDQYLRRSRWYGTVQWWRYYLPLVVQRQWVSYIRSRAASGSASQASSGNRSPNPSQKADRSLHLIRVSATVPRVLVADDRQGRPRCVAAPAERRGL